MGALQRPEPKVPGDFYEKTLEVRRIAREAREPVTRIRRGKVVTVPVEWTGTITTDRTKRARKKAAIMKTHGRRQAIRREIRMEEKLQDEQM